MSPVRVLIVDDSPTMRAMIASTLKQADGIEVVGAAGDPLEAREAIKALNPDVVTLDVEMPNMNGIEFLERLMRLRPTPVIMISTLTQEGAEVSLRALEIGAFDCVGKPSGGDVRAAFASLPDLIRAAAVSRVRARIPEAQAPVRAPASAYTPSGAIIAIGSSTGGVEALQTILSTFPERCPPTVITQHMPAAFTKSFAARLDKTCAPRVREAEHGAPLQVGEVMLAPGGECHMRIVRDGRGFHCALEASDLINGHRPSVDALFDSVAATAGARSVGVILTGMGRDGARGLQRMREAGARTIGQDEASCIVYGMPKAAFELGAVERQLPLTRIASGVLTICAEPGMGVA